jgi:hypothetical protein
MTDVRLMIKSLWGELECVTPSGSAPAQEVCVIPVSATPSAGDAPNFSRLAASVAS